MSNQKRKKKLRKREIRQTNAFRRRDRPTSLCVNDRGVTLVTTFEITYDPVPEPRFDRLPADVREWSNQFFLLAQDPSEEAISEIEELCRQYPGVPTFRNYLTCAYMNAGRTKDAVRELFDCYEEFPDYLFGRLNYALWCVQAGEHERVPEIFDDAFDLIQLGRGRRLFHVTEAVTFLAVMGLYHAKCDNVQAAQSCYDCLESIDPDAPAARLLYNEIRRQGTLVGSLLSRISSLKAQLAATM